MTYNGELYYHKRFLSSDHIDKYLCMQDKGIGVPVVAYNREQGEIVTEAGVELTALVKYRMNSPSMIKSVLDQINFIQITLRDMGVAHCDIKP